METVREMLDAIAGEYAIEHIDEHPVLVHTEGFKVTDLEKFENAPRRNTNHAKLIDTDSFVAYVARFKNPSTTSVYYSLADQKVRAILDHSEPAAPKWEQHTAELVVRHSQEFRNWKEILGKRIGQRDLAEFLHQMASTIREPATATLLEIVTDFRVTKSGSFRSAVNNHNGTIQLHYVDEKRGATEFEIPERLAILISIFEGAEPVALTVQFDYRESDGDVGFILRVRGLNDIIEDAFADIVNSVRVRLTDVWFFNGTP